MLSNYHVVRLFGWNKYFTTYYLLLSAAGPRSSGHGIIDGCIAGCGTAGRCTDCCATATHDTDLSWYCWSFH